MKYKKIFFLLAALLISGCRSNNKKTSQDASKSQETEETSMSLIADFVFGHIIIDGQPIAEAMFEGNYYSFDDEIKIDFPLVAGDQLNVTFNGEHETQCEFIYPNSGCHVYGEIKEYQLVKARILGIHVDDATIGEIADQIRGSYILPEHGNVILDDSGRYTSIDSYEGHDLYLSINRAYNEEQCKCPIGAECEECPLYVWGLYAFYPRMG